MVRDHQHLLRGRERPRERGLLGRSDEVADVQVP